MSALVQRQSANAIQQRWCEALLVRAPAYLTLIRTQIERSRTWLVEHPTETLPPRDRWRLCRFERSFDAEDAAIGLPEPTWPIPSAKKLPRQLKLPGQT